MSGPERRPNRAITETLRIGGALAAISGGSVALAEVFGAANRVINEADPDAPGFLPKVLTATVIGGIGAVMVQEGRERAGLPPVSLRTFFDRIKR